jgi:hypothetical protein
VSQNAENQKTLAWKLSLTAIYFGHGYVIRIHLYQLLSYELERARAAKRTAGSHITHSNNGWIFSGLVNMVADK